MKGPVPGKESCQTRHIQQFKQPVTQFLGLTFLHPPDSLSYANAILQLAFQRVATQVDRSLKSTSVMQAVRIFPARDRSCPKNRRLYLRLVEFCAQSFLQPRWPMRKSFKAATCPSAFDNFWSR